MKAVKDKDQLKKTVDSWKESSKNLWKLIDSGMTLNSKVGLGYDIQSNNEVLGYEEEMNCSVFKCTEEDYVNKPLYSRFTKTNNFKGVPHPLSGDYTSKPQEEIDESLYIYGKKGPQEPEPSVLDDRSSECSTCQSNDSVGSIGTSSEHSFDLDSEISRVPQEVYVSKPVTINEKGVSVPRSKEVEPSCVTYIKTPRQPIKDKETPKKDKKNWNAMMERELGKGYSFIQKKCFVCGSLSHLIKDCDYYEKKMAREAEIKKQRVFNTGNERAKPVWNNANRVNHANHFVPRLVQLNAVRPNFNFVRSNVNTGRANVNSVRRKVNTGSFNVNPVRPKQPVPTGISKSFSPDHPLKNIEDRGIFDSGCSGHMTGNKDHLEDFEEIKGGSVTFGGSKCYITGKGRIKVGNLEFNSVSFVKELGHFNLFSISQICDKQLKVPRQHNMYNFDMKTPSPAKGFACLIAKAKSDEYKLWHRRLGTSAVTNNAGTSEVTNSVGTLNTNASEEEDEAEELIIVPTAVQHTTLKVGTRKPFTNSKEEECLTELQNLQSQENKASPTSISEEAPNILAFRKKLDEIAQKHLGAALENKATSTSAVNTGSELVNTGEHDSDDSDMPELEIFHRPMHGIFNEASYDDKGVITDFNNLPTEVADEPKKISEALNNESWVEAIQEELLQFKLQHEEGINYDEVFAPVARIEAIRLFLVFASFMGFIIYQMDVKSAFLYGTIDEEVYVSQPPGFINPDHPKKEHRYRRGSIDKTLFIKKNNKDIMLVQVYVDDIIFGSTNKSWCDEFETLMKGRFQMSSMGELTFFLGLQVKQSQTGLFISQDKYVADMLKKFDLASVKTAITPMETKMALTKDEEGADVDVNPKVSHLIAVKRIFKYLKGKPNLGLWYPRESPFNLEAFSDSDYAGANLDRKSITGGCQFLGRRLISWQCKKQTIVATSTTEAEYVAAANCCGQILWIQNQLLDYGFNFMNTKIHIDNESTICIVKNLVFHSKTKNIEIRHHFIRDAYEKKLIQVQKIHTDNNVADLLTKAFDGPRFNFLVVNIGMAKHGFKDGLEHGLKTVVREKVNTGIVFINSGSLLVNPGFAEIVDFLRGSNLRLPVVDSSVGQEALSVTEIPPTSTEIPPTPPTTQPSSFIAPPPHITQPAPTESTIIPPTPIPQPPSPSTAPEHATMQHSFKQPSPRKASDIPHT
ncbi:putative ribonuclease H-like domain-containing protein [Tanacetum coccineum]